MRNYVAGFVLFVIANTCMASGWADLHGKSRNGVLIYIEPAWEHEFPPSPKGGYYIRVYKDGDTNSSSITYKNQKCKLTDDYLSCDKNGKSPLAEVKYKIVPNENPSDCSYANKFICIEGCNNNPNTQQTMQQSHWECYE